jgi:hypothetical protein
MWRSKTEKPEPKESDEWQIARDLAYLSLFNNWKDVVEANKKLVKIDGMINRDYELWKPILTIASLISEDVFEHVKDYAMKKIEENQNSLNVESAEYKLVKALHRLVEIDKWLNQKEIRLAWLNEFEEGEGSWITSYNTGQALERLGFRKIKIYCGNKQFLIKREFLDELIERLNIKIEDIQPLLDKKISHLNDKILEFIKTKETPSIKEIRAYFEGLGINPIELENIINKMKNNGIIFERTPGRYEAV